MSFPLNLPDYISTDEQQTEASDFLPEGTLTQFVNESLQKIQTFFSRMVQLDPDENFFGDTGRDANGFRLTTEDEPPGPDHDTLISLRSDHIAGIGIQAGKVSDSDAILSMGVWDDSSSEANRLTSGKWELYGALRIDKSEGAAFKIESTQAYIVFSQSAKRIDLENTDVFSIADRSSTVSPGSGHSGLVSKSGKLWAVDSSGNETQLTPD
jgi:hypothetical protein